MVCKCIIWSSNVLYGPQVYFMVPNLFYGPQMYFMSLYKVEVVQCLVGKTWNQMGCTCAKLCVGWWLHACAHTVLESQLPHKIVNLLFTITNQKKS